MGTIALVGARKPLDDSLKDDRADLFVFCGRPGSKAEGTYQAMKATPASWDGWQHIFLIRNLAQLTAQEKQGWFGQNPLDRYVVLRAPGNPKRIARQGPIGDLLTGDAPDILKIVDIFLS